MLRVMNSNFKIIDTLKKYTFAQYEDKFRDIGTFSVMAQLVDGNKYLLNDKEQYYILFDEYTIGKIEKIEKDSDSEYSKTLNITGKLANVLFTQRVINSQLTFKGNDANYVTTLMNKCFDLDKADGKRYVNINILLGVDTGNTTIDKQITGGYLWDELQDIMDSGDYGIFFEPSIKSVFSDKYDNETNIDHWNFSFSHGNDRRVGNKHGLTPLIFSQSLSNISRTSYSKDVENYKNVTYVAGEGEGTNRKWYELNINQDDAIGEQMGWNRSELWVDARDLQSEDANGNKITQAQYEANIKARAEEKAKENTVVNTYEATLTVKRLKYREDFQKGDWVTVKDEELGIIIDAQITSVTVTEQNSEMIYDVTLKYGKTKKTKIKQISDGLKKIEDIEANVKYLNDVNTNAAREYSFSGTYITNASGLYKRIFGLPWIRTMFKQRFGIESGTDPKRYTVVCNNGDDTTNNVHFDSVTYRQGYWYCMFGSNVTSTKRTTINYRVTVVLGEDFQYDED